MISCPIFKNDLVKSTCISKYDKELSGHFF